MRAAVAPGARTSTVPATSGSRCPSATATAIGPSTVGAGAAGAAPTGSDSVARSSSATTTSCALPLRTRVGTTAVTALSPSTGGAVTVAPPCSTVSERGAVRASSDTRSMEARRRMTPSAAVTASTRRPRWRSAVLTGGDTAASANTAAATAGGTTQRSTSTMTVPYRAPPKRRG